MVSNCRETKFEVTILTCFLLFSEKLSETLPSFKKKIIVDLISPVREAIVLEPD